MKDKKAVERYLKQAQSINPPERVWENIKNAPIIIKETEKKSKKKASILLRHSLLAGAALCTVLVFSIILSQQKSLNNTSLITEGQTTMNTTESSKTTNSSSSSEQEQAGNIYDLNIPHDRVWNNRLYVADTSNGFTLKDSDLDQEFSKTVNNQTIVVYSIKNQPIEKSFASKVGNIIVQYNCIYEDTFFINNKEYGLVEQEYYFYPEPEKGNYIGTINGQKVYEVIGNDEVVLIDLTSVVSANDEDNEYLFVAEILKNERGDKK